MLSKKSKGSEAGIFDFVLEKATLVCYIKIRGKAKAATLRILSRKAAGNSFLRYLKLFVSAVTISNSGGCFFCYRSLGYLRSVTFVLVA